jgi:hypothetical protein
MVIGALAIIVFVVVVAPEFTRNLVMLAYLRKWTKANDAGLSRLEPLARWWISIEHANPLLQAQASAVARTLDDDATASATLEKARSLAPIAEHCYSRDAMQLEHLARPIHPLAERPKQLAFVAHVSSDDVTSQMRTVFAENGGNACMHMLTATMPNNPASYAAMSVPLPVRPGPQYRIRTECYVTGDLRVTLDALGAGEKIVSASINAKDGWTTTEFELQPQSAYMMRLFITAHSGSGRVACRDAEIIELSSAAR